MSEHPHRRDYEDGRWHLDKRVNIGHIVATLVMAMSLIAWGNAIDKRVVALEALSNNNEKTNERQDRAASEALQLMRDEVRELRREVQGLRNDLSGGKR